MGTIFNQGALGAAIGLIAGTAAIAQADTINLNQQGDCRLYVESAVDNGPDHYEVIHVFLRTNSGFDSQITSITGSEQQLWDDGQGGHFTQAVQLPVTNVPGYGDLWETNITVSGDNDVSGFYNTRALVTFVVTTQKGTQYQLKASDGNPFTFDPNMYSNLERVMASKGLSRQYQYSSINSLAVHGNFPYLDPNGCETSPSVRGAPQYR